MDFKSDISQAERLFPTERFDIRVSDLNHRRLPSRVALSERFGASQTQSPTFGLVLQHHVGYLKQLEGKRHLPVGCYGFQQAGQQGGARHLVETN